MFEVSDPIDEVENIDTKDPTLPYSTDLPNDINCRDKKSQLNGDWVHTDTNSAEKTADSTSPPDGRASAVIIITPTELKENVNNNDGKKTYSKVFVNNLEKHCHVLKSLKGTKNPSPAREQTSSFPAATLSFKNGNLHSLIYFHGEVSLITRSAANDLELSLKPCERLNIEGTYDNLSSSVGQKR